MLLTIIGVIVSFIVMIVLIRKRINFGLSLIFGAVLLGIFSLETITPLDIPSAMITASIYSFSDHKIVTETIELALLTTLIYILAKSMQDTGSVKKLIDSLRTFFSKGGTLALIPAIYGLLPNPGGALFSAPMIDEEGNKYHLDNNQKNLLNLWFRHIWEPIYPVSAAMILICSVQFAHINIFLLALIDLPAFIAAVVIGNIFLKKYLKKIPKQQIKSIKKYDGLIFLFPPLVPLFFYIGLQFVGFSQIQSFLIGIVGSIILLYFLTKLDIKDFLQIIKKSLTWKLALAIFGIMIFRQMFEVSKAGTLIATLISGFPIPALAVLVLIPLIIGFLIGYNLGAIALSYFLVQPFFILTGMGMVSTTSIVFISTLVGYLISPIHLCNVLSSEYLKTDPTRIYKQFIPAAFILLIVQVVCVVVFAHFI